MILYYKNNEDLCRRNSWSINRRKDTCFEDRKMKELLTNVLNQVDRDKYDLSLHFVPKQTKENQYEEKNFFNVLSNYFA